MLGNVLETYREHPDSFRALQHRGMERNSSWDKAAAEYEQIFAWAKVRGFQVPQDVDSHVLVGIAAACCVTGRPAAA